MVRIAKWDILSTNHDAIVARRAGVQIRSCRLPDQAALTPTLERFYRLRYQRKGAIQFRHALRQQPLGLVAGRNDDVPGDDPPVIGQYFHASLTGYQAGNIRPA